MRTRTWSPGGAGGPGRLRPRPLRTALRGWRGAGDREPWPGIGGAALALLRPLSPSSPSPVHVTRLQATLGFFFGPRMHLALGGAPPAGAHGREERTAAAVFRQAATSPLREVTRVERAGTAGAAGTAAEGKRETPPGAPVLPAPIRLHAPWRGGPAGDGRPGPAARGGAAPAPRVGAEHEARPWPNGRARSAGRSSASDPSTPSAGRPAAGGPAMERGLRPWPELRPLRPLAVFAPDGAEEETLAWPARRRLGPGQGEGGAGTPPLAPILAAAAAAARGEEGPAGLRLASPAPARPERDAAPPVAPVSVRADQVPRPPPPPASLVLAWPDGAAGTARGEAAAERVSGLDRELLRAGQAAFAGVEAGPAGRAAPGVAHATAAAAAEGVDVERVTDEVYRRFEEKLRIERERRGL